MRYFTKEIASKILVAILTTALMAALGLVYNWWKGLDEMPGKMEKMEQNWTTHFKSDSLAIVKAFTDQKRKQDSVFSLQLTKIKHDNDSVTKLYHDWLDDDYRSIQELKKKCKIQ